MPFPLFGHAYVARGSKYPIFGVSGSKNHTVNGIWDQRPQMLGTWTLWVEALMSLLKSALILGHLKVVLGSRHLQRALTSEL